jgi:hypothetical protein
VILFVQAGDPPIASTDGMAALAYALPCPLRAHRLRDLGYVYGEHFVTEPRGSERQQ